MMKSVISLTFGDQAENHAGMQKIGNEIEEGLSIKELEKAQRKFEEMGLVCQLIDLNEGLPKKLREEIEEAAILIVRQGIEAFDIDHEKFYDEMIELDVDKKAKMRGRVVNKHARWNLVFGDEEQEPNYEEGEGRIIKFEDIDGMQKIRADLPKFFGKKSKKLVAELNLYYNLKECGIGWHGDGERKIVICLRLGKEMALHYQWYHETKPLGRRIIINIDGGDLYAMSAKAVGTDWKRRTQYTLRHAAGCEKYVNEREAEKKIIYE